MASRTAKGNAQTTDRQMDAKLCVEASRSNCARLLLSYANDIL